MPGTHTLFPLFRAKRKPGSLFPSLSLLFILLLFILLLLTACSKSPAPDDYFPLEKGLHWDYKVSTDLIDRKLSSNFSMENIGPGKLAGQDVFIRRSSDNTDYYIRKFDYGVYRVGKRTMVELAPQTDDPRRMIMPDPPGKTGQTWSQLSHPYTLRRISPTEKWLTRTIQLEMTYELAALGETVDVPAGTFENCLRIDGEGQFSMYIDPLDGYKNIEVNTREWYAPGVGLVKLEREEPLNSKVYRGGSVTIELIRKSF